MKFQQALTIIFLYIFLGTSTLLAQIPQVPSQLEFADLTVRITPQAQREIQLDVDAQYRNPSYFKVKQDRINLYMPIVVRELKSLGVPEDLKYLVIQESGLIPDAVSTSNAVGFWQFKQGTAEEVGLRVDAQVDERKNIASSSRGAGLYLKKHNSSLDNWMTALVSYQMGLGGAKAYFGNQFSGKKIIEVDRNTHWYFKKYLAHKIAYGNQIGMFVSNQKLVELKVQGPVTMAVLSKRLGVSEAHLKEFNKWAGNGRVPAGTFTVFYIKEASLQMEPAVIKSEEQPKKQQTAAATAFKNSPVYKQANSYPRISGNTTKANQPNQITVNELDGVLAGKTTSPSKFSEEIGVKEKKFLRLNDMESGERIETGKYYYTEKKKASAEVENHLVLPGETLWSISQKYGIRLSALKSKNRIRKDSDLKAGMVLNLKEARKRGEDIPIIPISQPVQQNTPTTVITTAETKREEVIYTPKKEVIQESSTHQVTHTVSQGETLFAISKKYGVSVDNLKSWNNIGSQNIISIGQKLVIFKP